MGLRRLVLLTVALLTICFQALAQTQAINGSIRGRVTDPAGAAVPQAAITAVNMNTGYSRDVTTNSEGFFVIPNLPIGLYTVEVKKEGFETQRRTGINLSAGIEAVIDAELKVGAVSTTVEVTGGAPIIEPTRVSTGRTIDHTEVDNLPLTSRNPYNFIIFQPGVSGHPNPELGIPRTLNTNGLLDRINYQMDGMVDTESDRYGLRLFPISAIYVREIQTVSNSYAPEFGGTAGNIYNVITNSGTNDFHGEFAYMGRPTDLSARPILLSPTAKKPDLTLSDYVVNSGGPIIKDKLFFFGGYEHLTRGLPQPNTINPASAAQIGLPASLLAVAPSVQHAQFFNFRTDWVINSKNQVFVRYNYFRNEYPFNSGVGGLNALDVASNFHDRVHLLGMQLLTTFSPTVLNELRFGWPYRNEQHVAGPTSGPGPQISISGVATFNGTAAGDRFQEKIPNMNDAFTVVRGSHTLKFGAGFQQILDTQVSSVNNVYTFASIAAYLQAKSGANPYSYSTYSTTVGIPGAWYHSFFWNWFAQDSFQVSPSLLMIFGVRYDRFQSPNPDPTATFPYSKHFRNPGRDFAPRFGLAWRITPKTVLRASSGIFYEPSPTNLWYNVFSTSNPNGYQASLQPGSPLAPAFPNIIAFQPGVVAPSSRDITAVTPNYKNAYTINSSLQISQQFGPNDSITVGYVNTGARDLQYLRNMNLINPIGYLGDGRPVFSSAIDASTRLFPQYNNITLEDVGASMGYNALIVNYRHQWAQGYQISASYTWSHSISDAPDSNSFEENSLIEDPTNRARDRGNSRVNRPQAFTMSTVIGPSVKLGNRVANWLANNNQLTLLANISSGDQQNIAANKVLNGDTKATSRPLFIGRNTVRGPNIYQIDGRYTRSFFTLKERLKPSFMLEANNIFNHPNITSLNTTVPVNAIGVATLPSRFAPVSTVLEGRIIQMGVRLDW
jgi:hypothetical protein